jgi:hypothetical protein
MGVTWEQPERRAPQPLLFSTDQLLGRRPIHTRRRADKVRIAVHLAVAAALVAVTLWWVVLPHAFAGDVLVRLTSTHGIHAGDLPSLLFAVAAALTLRRLRRPRIA